MLATRIFNLFVAVALMAVTLLTIREVAATKAAISYNMGSVGTLCESLPSQLSFHSKYISETHTFMTYTEDGPTGVDGGLIYLTSVARSCTR